MTTETETDFEEYQPGQRRKFEDCGKFVRILISHRLTSANVVPAQWSIWELWGHGTSEADARQKHDDACANGPWYKSKGA